MVFHKVVDVENIHQRSILWHTWENVEVDYVECDQYDHDP